MNLAAIPAGIAPFDEVNVVIEVPIGGPPIKYEMDKVSGALTVDRLLHTPMYYPGNYGLMPNTLSEDGDPCNVLVANTRAIQPSAVLAVRPVWGLLMQDEHGPDEKIIGVPAARLTRRYDGIQACTDLPEITRQQIQHFFEHYKDLEPAKWVRITGWADTAAARSLIAAAHARHQHQLALR